MMRKALSDLITQAAISDPRFVILSGDHGYALFDQVRAARPKQFVNVGVMEQALVGIAAGLYKTGFFPMIYGLASFIPIRVLEQIKLDLCYSKIPVVILGDGAGLVYSTLGSTHQCGEDVACLRSLPNMKIFSPGNPEELRACFGEAMRFQSPSYLRIGKSDRAAYNSDEIQGSAPYFTRRSTGGLCFVAAGSMTSIAHELAGKFDASCLSIMTLKPLDADVVRTLEGFRTICIFEEHHRSGGLASGLTDLFVDHGKSLPRVSVYALRDQFAERAGSYQYALSEHKMSDLQLEERVRYFLRASTEQHSLPRLQNQTFINGPTLPSLSP